MCVILFFGSMNHMRTNQQQMDGRSPGEDGWPGSFEEGDREDRDA